jgi:hypothetical protein
MLGNEIARQEGKAGGRIFDSGQSWFSGLLAL